MLFIFTTPNKRTIAAGHKPNYVQEEIVRAQEELDLDSPMGEKPWPLRMAIPAMIKYLGRLYMWGCTVGVTAFIIFVFLYEGR